MAVDTTVEGIPVVMAEIGLDHNLTPLEITTETDGECKVVHRTVWEVQEILE